MGEEERKYPRKNTIEILRKSKNLKKQEIIIKLKEENQNVNNK